MEFKETFLKLRQLSQKYRDIDEDPLFADAYTMLQEFAAAFNSNLIMSLEDIGDTE